ncbi:MAG: glutamate-ammonia-ligase adenylyltransferase, partial [Sediminispirochaetaceae bacterium]
MKAADFFQNKPSPDEYRDLAPDLPEEECRRQVELLPEQYFRLYPKKKLARNAGLLASLGRKGSEGRQAPYRYLIETSGEGEVEVTVITFDTKALFSLVTGALSAGGMDIQAGDIFSYRELKAPQPPNSPKLSPAAARYRRRRTADRSGQMRKVVDVFRGRSVDEPGGTSSSAAFRQELEKTLEEVLGSLFRDWDSAAGRRVQTPSGGGYNGGSPATGVEKAKERVAEMLSRRLLSRREHFAVPQMFPIELDVGSVSNPADEEEATRLHIRSQDTPFFLYTIGTVLSVHGISIEHVEIHTTNRAIEDTFYVRTAGGRPVTDEKLLRSLKLSILFTKQFTYFLWNAPDPYRALLRFETLLGDLRRVADEETVSSLIADSNVLKRLSRLLGTSDFIWEDFIRLQYENIIPLIAGTQEAPQQGIDRESLEGELTERLKGVEGFDERKRVLNEFKDWYTYLADLEHILGPGTDLQLLNERLTDIAELVVREAFRIAWDHLAETYGVPRTVADLPAVYAVFGLGKFGGRALGYASDIELMTLYRDAGETGGLKQVSNAEFFSGLVQTASLIIESKQEGIYRVDLRLRPYGSGGPLAVRLNQFVSYYRDEASSLEKIALARMRAVAGDPEFGAQVERLRDTILYEGGSVDVDELVRLRKIQAGKYDSGEDPNVKYGSGGLVDLEYCVQTLQVMDGRNTPELRTPYMSEVLARLMELGTLDQETTGNLEQNYLFLRRLLNALRMLRGNALDLYLPRRGTSEYFHLARRMGYREENGVSAEEQLWVDFQKNTAMVRNFVEHQLGSQ